MAYLVDYSDQKIESLVDEMEDFIDLFESIKKPQRAQVQISNQLDLC